MWRTTARLWRDEEIGEPELRAAGRASGSGSAPAPRRRAREVGSSQTRNSGSVASARAIEMRWRWPPENSCGILLAVQRRRGRRRVSSSPTRASSSAASRDAGRSARIGSATMSLDAPARVEARVRVLEDHLHAPAQLPALGRAARVRAMSMPSKMIGAARRRVEPDDQARDRGLAAAGLADERQRLAAADREGRRRRPRAAAAAARRSSTRLSHGARDVEVAREVASTSTSGAWRASAAALMPRACRGRSVVQPAGGARRAGRQQLGPLDAAAVEDARAARVEGAARRDGVQARHRARRSAAGARRSWPIAGIEPIRPTV